MVEAGAVEALEALWHSTRDTGTLKLAAGAVANLCVPSPATAAALAAQGVASVLVGMAPATASSPDTMAQARVAPHAVRPVRVRACVRICGRVCVSLRVSARVSVLECA